MDSFGIAVCRTSEWNNAIIVPKRLNCKNGMLSMRFVVQTDDRQLMGAHLHLIGTQPSTRLLKLAHDPDGSSLPTTQEIKVLICLRCLSIICLSLCVVVMAVCKGAVSI